MPSTNPIKIRSLLQLYEVIPEHERIIVDVLRQLITEQLPPNGKEKISYNVPFFYGNKGVLLGFWYGNRLIDTDNYLTHGTNKQIFYKIFNDVDEINIKAVVKLLREAVKLDEEWKK